MHLCSVTMAFFARAKKVDLLELASELVGEVDSNLRVIDLKKLIETSEDYDAEYVEGCLMRIIETRKEREENRKEQEKIDRDERDKERQFELDRLRIARQDVPDRQLHEVPRHPGNSLRNMMQKFDPEETDISLYLSLFERQAEHLKIPESEWAGSILSLLPLNIATIVLREKVEDTKDYFHIKNVLLERFSLSPEAFRQKFVHHNRKAGNLWKDYLFEIRNYFEGWIEGLGIKTYDSLKDLILVDQLKRKMGNELKEHHLKEWERIVSPENLANLGDQYELLRKSNKSLNQQRKFEGRILDVQKPYPSNKPGDKSVGKSSPATPAETKKEKSETSRLNEIKRRDWKHREFDRKRASDLICFQCNEPGHIRPNCPLLAKREELNALDTLTENTDPLAPFVSVGTVNGKVCEILRDSGATVDLVCRKFITSDDYIGETIWVNQPLDTHAINLPLARVSLRTKYGDITTKACVISDAANQQRYILGNQTANLLKECGKTNTTAEINVVTRSQKNQNNLKSVNLGDVNKQPVSTRENVDNGSKGGEANEYSTEIVTDNAIVQDNGEEAGLELPLADLQSPEFDLLKISPEIFKRAQTECIETQELLKRVEDVSSGEENKNYVMINGLLSKIQLDHMGEKRKLLVVPKPFRKRILALCHEGTSAHVGVTKSKQRMAKLYFWPRCYQDMEEYVKTCDACQRVGNAQDVIKAPMHLTPIISEPFVKINIDACGPLPESETGNRYLITAICLASKYPDAVPVRDISSLNVTDALLQVFSRLGFPKEIQCDNGTSFTSNLTTEFFEKFGIKVTRSSVGHPQSNPVERFHRTLKRLLRVLCLENGESWERHLPASLLALRTVTHTSTGFSPAELLYGKNLRTPEVLVYERWVGEIEKENPVTEHALTLMNRLKRAQELAAKKMGELQVKRKETYDRNAVRRNFAIGDSVLIFALARPNKLAPKWVGPGTIEARISETNYRVRTPGPRGKVNTYHVNMLKPYARRPESINWVCEEKTGKEQVEEFEIHTIDAGPNDFDYSEIVRESELDARLNINQQNELRKLLCKHAKIFSNSPGRTDKVIHDIELISDKVIRSRPYKASHRQNELLKAEIDKMLNLGVIEVGESDYTSPMLLVESVGRDPRPCIDYRRLNEIIRTEYYPLPNIEERVEQVAGSDFITVLDLAKGYWQIPLTKRAQRIAAFVTAFGTFRPLRMPFGLKNAPYFFSKLMADVLNGCDEYAVPYIDDIAVFSKTWDEHLKHLDNVLSRVAKAKLTIKSSKCRFAQNHVKYLGHMVGGGYRNPAELKVQCIKDFPRPDSKTNVRAFLGLTGYYAHYIPHYSVIAAPLTEALKGKEKRAQIKWDEACERAFTTLKELLTKSPVLHAPDYSSPFIVQTDASDIGVGVVLAQRIGGKEHPILFLSRKFNDAEKNIVPRRRSAQRLFSL